MGHRSTILYWLNGPNVGWLEEVDATKIAITKSSGEIAVDWWNIRCSWRDVYSFRVPPENSPPKDLVSKYGQCGCKWFASYRFQAHKGPGVEMAASCVRRSETEMITWTLQRSLRSKFPLPRSKSTHGDGTTTSPTPLPMEEEPAPRGSPAVAAPVVESKGGPLRICWDWTGGVSLVS